MVIIISVNDTNAFTSLGNRMFGSSNVIFIFNTNLEYSFQWAMETLNPCWVCNTDDVSVMLVLYRDRI